MLYTFILSKRACRCTDGQLVLEQFHSQISDVIKGLSGCLSPVWDQLVWTEDFAVTW